MSVKNVEVDETALVRALATELESLLQEGFWDDRLLAKGFELLGKGGMEELFFPAGCGDFGVAFLGLADQAMLAEELPSYLGIKQRVSFLIRARLQFLLSYRRLSLAVHGQLSPRGKLRAAWHVADLIWSTLGDRSADYNYYTKRTLLAGVYGSALLHMRHREGGLSELSAFVERRLEDVMVLARGKRVAANLFRRGMRGEGKK